MWDLQRSKEIEGSIGGLSAALYLRNFQRCLFCFKAADFLDDMLLTSMHGRSLNLLDALKKSGKVFTLASDAKSIRNLQIFCWSMDGQILLCQ